MAFVSTIGFDMGARSVKDVGSVNTIVCGVDARSVGGLLFVSIIGFDMCARSVKGVGFVNTIDRG
eukprot:390784-Rhodomonas_salina.1